MWSEPAKSSCSVSLGRVCVPIDPLECESFDPFRVPTLRVLATQIDQFDQAHGQDQARATPGEQRSRIDPHIVMPPAGLTFATYLPLVTMITLDYKKTELRKSIELFEKFLIDPMAAVMKRRLRMERERK